MGVDSLVASKEMASKIDIISSISSFLGKYEARDKLGRGVQYGCRFLNGVISECEAHNMPVPIALQPKVQALLTILSDARRTHRWGKEFNSWPAMLKAWRQADYVEWLSKAALCIFLIFDHLGWLRKLKIIGGDAKRTIRMGLRVLSFSWTMQILSHYMKLRKLRAENRNSLDTPEVQAEARKLKKGILQYSLLVFQGVHVSMLFQHHDILAGLAGIITSAMECHRMFPVIKNKAA